MAVRNSASLPPAAARLEARQDEHEGAKSWSCSPCGELLSLSAVRAGDPAAYKHALSTYAAGRGHAGRWAVGLPDRTQARTRRL